ncbi:MAG: GatB/YqeY domain-containing protein [Verrucomicrobiaceae bacterium]
MPAFTTRVSEDLKNAMRAKDTVALNVIRALKSAMKYAAIEKLGADSELEDGDALVVVRREIKKRQDSVASYEKAARADLADVEKAEIAVLEKYLPAAMNADDLIKLVEAVITETGATSKKDMGKVMKILQERTAGAADNKTLSAEVSSRLQ